MPTARLALAATALDGLVYVVGGVNPVTGYTNVVEVYDPSLDPLCGSVTPTANAGPDQTRDEGETVPLDGLGSSDPQGDPLTYAWAQVAGTPVTLDDPTSPTPSFTAPYVRANETLTFELVVDDGTNVSDPNAVDITVVNVNNAPVADAGDDSTIKEGATGELDGSNSYDPEDDPITYDWVQKAGPSVTLLPDETVVRPTFVAPLGVGQVLVFKLAVDDGFETSVRSPGTDSTLADTVAKTVVENSQPVADAGGDQTKDEGSNVVLDGSDSFDSDTDDTLSYEWTQTGGTVVALSDATAVMPSFDAPPVGPGGEALTFELVVTDDDPVNPKSSDAKEVVINVRNINDPPSCALAVAAPDGLWPPNHKMLEVAIDGVMDEDSVYNMITLQVTGVTQDEPVDGLGDGDSSPDAVIQAGDPADGVLIRAERSGTGNGRVYEITFTADDGFEACTGAVTVVVPHSRKSPAVDDGQAFDATQTQP